MKCFIAFCDAKARPGYKFCYDHRRGRRDTPSHSMRVKADEAILKLQARGFYVELHGSLVLVRRTASSFPSTMRITDGTVSGKTLTELLNKVAKGYS